VSERYETEKRGGLKILKMLGREQNLEGKVPLEKERRLEGNPGGGE